MPFVIPSIFTAVDKSVSSTLGAMSAKMKAFGSISEDSIARAEHGAHQYMGVLHHAGGELFQFAKTAAIAAAIVGSLEFSADKIIEFEKANTNLRNRLSELTDTQFKEYQAEIFKVANATHKSSIEITESFDKIIGLNKEFGATAEGLGKVSDAAVVLAEATGVEIPAAAEQLVGVMNQFKLGAEEASRTINVLAAGQHEGATTVEELSQALTNFGPAARGANVTLEQSVGLLDLMSKFGQKGSEAGSMLRMTIVRLQKAGIGYVNGQFDVNAALSKTAEELAKVHNAKLKDAWLTQKFGARNVATARILLDNVEAFQEYTKSVTDTQQATEMAERKAKDFGVRLEALKNKFINLITGSDDGTQALGQVGNVIDFVRDNMEDLLTFVKDVGIGFGIFWGVIGIMKAFRGVMLLVTAAQWLWNIAMTANPIGIIIVAIAALVTLIIAAIYHWKTWGQAILLFMGPIGWLISLIASLHRNWGMVVQAFKQNGILGAIKAIGKVLLDAILWPLQKILEVASNLPGIGDWAKQGADEIAGFRKDLGVNDEETDDNKPFPARMMPVMPIKTAQNDQIMQQLFAITGKQTAELVIKNETGNDIKVNKSSGMKIKMSSTIGQFGGDEEDEQP